MALLDELEAALLRIGSGGPSGDAMKLANAFADEPARRAWSIAVAATEASARPGPAPDPESLLPLAGDGDVQMAVLRACASLQRSALLAFDRQRLARVAGVLAARAGEQTVPRLHAESARLWGAYLDGSNEVAPEAAAARAACARASLAELVVEMTALEALGHLAAGDTRAGVAAARRAARMARSEGILPVVWLADVVLARARRHASRAHLSARITSALAAMVPPPWQAWVAWERLLAGGLLAGDVPGDSAAAAAVRALDGMLGAAESGDRPRFDEQAARAAAALAPCQPLRRDVLDLQAALDPTSPASADLRAWRTGAVATLAGGLQGVCGRSAARGAQTPTFATVVFDGATGQRLLDLGAPLLATAAAARIDETASVRTLATLVALALAGAPGLDRAALFQRVYGFAFAPEVHGTLFDVLLHRARKLLGDRGEIAREGKHLILRTSGALLLPDPSCGVDVAERLLTFIAASGSMTTEQAAEALGLPVRTVRTAVRRLVDEGVCHETRDGRHLSYRIEDTTFEEPTPFSSAQG